MALLPKNSARIAGEPSLPPGALVMYESDGTPLIACVLGIKRRYQLLNERGREAELDAERLHRLPGSLPSDCASTEAKTKFLAALGNSARTKAAAIALDELWSVLAPDAGGAERAVDIKELSSLYHRAGVGPEEYAALRIALIADKIYFKRNKEDFTPRTPEVVKDLKHAAEVRARKLERHDRFIEWCQKRLKDANTPLPPELNEPLRLLEDIAVETQTLEPAQQKDAKELIERCAAALHLEGGASKEQRAFEILTRAGHFVPTTNLVLVRYRPPLEFSPEALTEARAIRQPAEVSPEELRVRSDLRHLDAFTIDDASTRDMDDALSIERHGGGYRLGVHISDVASYIVPGSAVDREARLRATSLYIPERTVNMLPEPLSEEELSLVAGKPRRAVSILFDLSHDYKVTATRIELSVIQVKRRLTYDDALHLLEGGDHDLGVIYNAGTNHEEGRLRAGAMKVNKREILVVPGAGSAPIRLVEIDEHDPARNMIAETAIMANRALAEFMLAHKIPAIYRSQEKASPEDRSINAVPEGPARDYAHRARLKKSIASLTPSLHSSLGLDAYLQSTSPIRRYVDLCNQRQILSYLSSGQPRYAAEELQQLMVEVEEPLGRAVGVSRESKRFWVLRYLQQRAATNKNIEGVVIRTDLKSPIVELDEVFVPMQVRLADKVKPGDKLRLKIVSIDPQRDYIRLEREA